MYKSLNFCKKKIFRANDPRTDQNYDSIFIILKSLLIVKLTTFIICNSSTLFYFCCFVLCKLRINHICLIFYLDKAAMTSAKKSVRTIRSREDYDLFKISYPLYDPQTVSSIELHLGPGQFLRPG